METNAQFDLNKAIRDWREGLASSPALRSSDMDELESHLRDGIAVMEAKGLAPHEAFWVATSRVGTYRSIEAEFGKVNLQHIWIQRLLWMLSGSLILGFIFSFGNSLSTLAGLGVRAFTSETGVVGPVVVVLRVVIIALIALFFWRSGQRSDASVWRLGKWFKANPKKAALTAFLVTAMSVALSLGTSMLMARGFPVSGYVSLVSWNTSAALVVSLLAPPIILGWLLARSTKNEVIA